MPPSPSIAIFGGSEPIPPEKAERFRDGCRRATDAGWEVLTRGGSAVDAVEAAILVMEEDPVFNAGYGSQLNADGEVQNDASIMDGERLDCGAVAFVQGVWNPIRLARAVLQDKEVLLAGDGAHRFAVEKDVPTCPKEALVTEERVEEWKQKLGLTDTVGAVAIDRSGHVAAGASTGGTGGNRRGRVGDSPQVGAGFYADDSLGAVVFTGDGEQIARMALGKRTVDGMAGDVPPETALSASLDAMVARVGGEAGGIAVDRHGRLGWAHRSPNMAVGLRAAGDSEARVYLHKDEE